ncbi:Na+/H+ antiporter subunit E [Nitrosococcus oceani]|uniref:Na+/H+ antiporter subunit E n=1 Tax=Nitrosococcus oceani TaxID=1229 RepID=UPI001E5B19A7|nr:Na+/H+ antiporter subunit E [Nitrosococcus oceani]
MLKSPSTQQFLQISWRPILVRILLFACLWWILTDGTPASWSVGVPAILIASYISLRFSRAIPFKLDYLSLLSFILFFCWQSLLAGIDVAKRVLQPRLPLNLGLVEFPTQLSPGTPAHTLLVNAINLLPGTLVTRIRRHSLTLHVLDTQAPIAAEAQALETRIAALFRLPHTNSSNNEKTGNDIT